MTIADKCPACGSHDHGSSPIMGCRHPWHQANPEMMFSFRLPGPQYSRTVSETYLKSLIQRARREEPAESNIMTLALAAERMIENEKAPKPKPKPLKLNPAELIRPQLAELLRDIGLEPSRFLNDPAKDKPVCMPGTASNKAVADKAARELAQLIKDDLSRDIDVNPILLRLWLIARWDAVAKLAHQIHGSGS